MESASNDDGRTGWSHHWPGVRDPTGWEVHHANDRPAANFLSSFQAALLHDEEVVENETNEALIMQLQTQQQALQSTNETFSPYTYPLSTLLRIPAGDVVTDEDITRLQNIFLVTFRTHILLGAWLNPSKLSRPKYLRYICACLGAARSEHPNDGSLAAKLCMQGAALWVVTMEMDNREARKLESVLGAVLVCTYGMLTEGRHEWRMVTGMIYSLNDIVRRLRLTEEGNASSHNALAYYCMLIDTIVAVQYTASTPCLSSNEFSTRMPDSQWRFRSTYRDLLNDRSVPADMIGRQDALVLLTALLSDVIYVRRSQALATDIRGNEDRFRPLTVQTQGQAMMSKLENACTRWMNQFARHAGNDVLALYYYVRLYLAMPTMDELVCFARDGVITGTITVSRQAVQLAWSVLEYVKKALRSEVEASQVWLSVTLYHATLVVWYELRSTIAGNAGDAVSLFMPLAMFKNELLKMPWPFCVNTVSRIDALIADTVPMNHT